VRVLKDENPLKFEGTSWATAKIQINNRFDGSSRPALFASMTLDAKDVAPE
jgi:hypothetical protein